MTIKYFDEEPEKYLITIFFFKQFLKQLKISETIFIFIFNEN
jgi:hypothetical protein